MRLFTAIELPDAVRDHLQSTQDVLRAHALLRQGVSWTAPHNLHLTLKFMGEVPDAQIPPLARALQVVEFAPLSLVPDHLTVFPPRGPARVISVGLRGDIEPLRTIFERTEDVCAPSGIARESRRYMAHITLARVRQPSNRMTAQSLLDAARLAHFPAPAFDAREFVLMQSQLDSAGSVYTVLARFPARPGTGA